MDKRRAEKALIRFYLQNDFQLQEEALPLARTLTYQNPEDWESLDLLAQVLFALQYDQRAEEILERIIQIAPDFAAAHLHLANVWLSQGKANLAYPQLIHAISLAKDDPVGEQARRLLQNYFP